MIQLAVLGYGNIGSGVVEVLEKNKASISKKAEHEICVKYILDLRDFKGTKIEELLVSDFDIILQDDTVQIVVETMGGTEPAYTYVKNALLHGKSVVTSNKELVAKYGAQLLEIAKRMRVNFLFEASVGGGIPIIRPMNQSLTADEVEEITGILNGTTNFILTKMSQEGLSFEAVLKEAQDKGYAERNPAADVEGHDACRKIAILSSLAFGMNVNFEQIYTEGITEITSEDMAYAKKLGCDIKLLATSRKVDHQVFAMVAPMMIGKEHPLYNVHDVFNAILIKGNVIGDVMFYGRGAGKLPTASAVVADVIDAVKHLGTNIMTVWSAEPMVLMPVDEVQFKHFVLAKTDFYEAALDSITKIFGVIQSGTQSGFQIVSLDESEEEIAFVTGKISEKQFNQQIELLKSSAPIIEIKSKIRVEE